MENKSDEQVQNKHLSLVAKITSGCLALAFSGFIYAGHDLYQANKKHEELFMKKELGIEVIDNSYQVVDPSKLEKITELGIEVINHDGKYICTNWNKTENTLVQLSQYLSEARRRGILVTSLSLLAMSPIIPAYLLYKRKHGK